MSSSSTEITESMASRVSRSGTSDVKLTRTFWRNLDQVFHFLDEDHLALLDDSDAIADGLDLGEVVAAEEDGLPLCLEILEDPVNARHHEGVEARGWLVQDQEIRLRGQGQH